MENLKGKSMDLTEDNLNKLKELFPEVFEEGKIDFDKLRLLLGDEVDDNEERYEFTWHGKNNAIRIAQTPSTGTLRPDKESSKNWDDTENLYIEGDNLEVLKLLQKSYFGKVKMIYIDPPYNTGNDFVYKDNLRDSIDNYKRITNQTTRANPETNGRYHTDWLNMMYPRLKLARNLLREDGVIFISIDDNEVENLKKICNDIFGECNFAGMFPWRKRTAKSDVPFGISQDYEWILAYAKTNKFIASIKNKERKYYTSSDYPNRPWRIHDMSKQTSASERPNSFFDMIDPKTGKIYPANPNAVWRITKETFNEYYEHGRIVFPGDYDFLNISKPVLRYFKDDDMNKGGKMFGYKSVSTKLPDDIGLNQDGTKLINTLFQNKVFSFPKPVSLIKYLVEITTNLDNESIIMDFFSGASTTANSVIELNIKNNSNKKFIMVQLPELTDEKSEAYKAGYKNICEIGKERIRRAGDKIVSENKDKEGIENLDIGFKVFKLDSSNLKSWDSSMDNLEQNLLDMVSNLKQDRTNEDLLYEILLKSGVELTAKIEEIKVGYNTLYNIGCGALLVCLDDKITQDVIDEIPKHKSPFMDTKVIFKEAGFMSDAAKINAVQNLKQFKIEDVRSV